MPEGGEDGGTPYIRYISPPSCKARGCRVEWRYNPAMLRVEIHHNPPGEAVLMIDDIETVKAQSPEWLAEHVNTWIEKVHTYDDKMAAHSVHVDWGMENGEYTARRTLWRTGDREGYEEDDA
jgi:hypothetical protein